MIEASKYADCSRITLLPNQCFNPFYNLRSNHRFNLGLT